LFYILEYFAVVSHKHNPEKWHLNDAVRSGSGSVVFLWMGASCWEQYLSTVFHQRYYCRKI